VQVIGKDALDPAARIGPGLEFLPRTENAKLRLISGWRFALPWKRAAVNVQQRSQRADTRSGVPSDGAEPAAFRYGVSALLAHLDPQGPSLISGIGYADVWKASKPEATHPALAVSASQDPGR
jgi:hypothetical protein